MLTEAVLLLVWSAARIVMRQPMDAGRAKDLPIYLLQICHGAFVGLLPADLLMKPDVICVRWMIGWLLMMGSCLGLLDRTRMAVLTMATQIFAKGADDRSDLVMSRTISWPWLPHLAAFCFLLPDGFGCRCDWVSNPLQI
ncbi:hypothetical protein ACLOJK_004298 [Asimina triloba]